MDVYRGKRVTVMGLGCFGGGIGAARFFAERGALVTVTDLRPAEDLRPSLEELAGLPIASYRFGGHHEEDFTRADLVVASPAVASDNPYLQTALRSGAALTTEINLFLEHCRAPIIGVTGSHGKSTTAALIHALLEAGGRRSWLGGNIGASLLPRVGEIAADDIVVLELSSFQLEALSALRRSPHVAVVTNFTPNHLDRHGTVEAYRHAKQNILRFQRPGDLAVLNIDDPEVAGWARLTPARVLGFALESQTIRCASDGVSQNAMPADSSAHWLDDSLLDGFRLPGRHNRLNALAAITVARAVADVSPDAARRALVGFRGLPHRLEWVAEIAGRKFYNDSIATTPEATLAALSALEGPVILLAGGSDKGLDFTAWAEAVVSRCKAAALFGQMAPMLVEEIEEAIQRQGAGVGDQGSGVRDQGLGVGGQGSGPHSQKPKAESRKPAFRFPLSAFRHWPHRDTGIVSLPIYQTDRLEAALHWAWRRSSPGDVILLSPACASYDQFLNYEHRGETFRQLVAALRYRFPH